MSSPAEFRVILPTKEDDEEQIAQHTSLQQTRIHIHSERSLKAANAYFHKLALAILEAHSKMLEYRKKTGKECIYIRLAIGWGMIFELESDDKTKHWKVPLHEVHYGGKTLPSRFMNKRSWYDREKNAVFENLFKNTQRDLFQQRGFYLLDESDGNKGFSSHIKLYFQKPNDYDDPSKWPLLWHGLNRLPD